MAYIIWTAEDADLIIDADDFARQLRARWTSVRDDTFKDPVDLFAKSWYVQIVDIDHWIILHEDQRTVSIDDADDTVVAKFASWYRSLIPAIYPLFMAHDIGGEEHVELTEAITEEEVLEQLNNLP